MKEGFFLLRSRAEKDDAARRKEVSEAEKEREESERRIEATKKELAARVAEQKEIRAKMAEVAFVFEENRRRTEAAMDAERKRARDREEV